MEKRELEKNRIETLIRESLLKDVSRKIEEAIDSMHKDGNHSSLDELVLAGDTIVEWMKMIKETSVHDALEDPKLLIELAQLKRNYIAPARKEAAEQIKQIVEESENGKIGDKINLFFAKLHQRGINLDGVSETEFSSIEEEPEKSGYPYEMKQVPPWSRGLRY